MTITKFAFPTTIHFGAGARALAGPHLLEMGRKRPLIVTDRALSSLPVLAEFKSQLRELEVAVFGGIHGNPTCAMVMSAAAAFKVHG
ncbi:MAG TPA: iron-containing alcohol dehydrogenase, partial [Burkholderiaceae bacterium]|nr:iron-containing alcohol dehydrogenase [Burkholderiaceae bacterium]